MSTTINYNDAIAIVNKERAYFEHCGKTGIITEKVDPVTGQRIAHFSAIKDIAPSYANKFTQNNEKRLTWFKAFLESPKRREFLGGVKFDPNKNGHDELDPNKKIYNLWTGLIIEPRPGNWDIFKEHIFKNVCRESSELFNYVLDWLADLYQNAGILPKPGVALILKGKKGTGKTKFGTLIGKPFGIHFLHAHYPLTDKFNDEFKNKVLVLGDEASWGGNIVSNGRLKGMISDDIIHIEGKGTNKISIENHIRFILASNESWVVPASYDERRYLVLDISPARMQDNNYFARMDKEMIEDGGLKAMVYELVNREIKSNLSKAPKTSGLWQEIEQGLNPEESWFYDILQTGKLITTTTKGIDKKLLHGNYLNHCLELRKPPKTQHKLTRIIKELCPVVEDRPDGPDRRKHFFFPQLDKCRESFEHAIGWTGKIKWE